MSLVAIIESVSSLAQLLQLGVRPAAVGTWSTAVADACRAAGLPALLEDDVLSDATREAIQAHADALVAALAGREVPRSEAYEDWAWWALESPLMYVASQGARTRHLFDALRLLAPDATQLVHDFEGSTQGAVLNITADEAGLEVAAFAPADHQADAVSRRHDYPVFPGPVEEPIVGYRGVPLPKGGGPYVVVQHTNEIAHLIVPLSRAGAGRFAIVKDAHLRWPATYNGLAADAEPTGERAPFVTPVWPDRVPAEPWEREVMEHLFITWQASMRQLYHWTLAAYRAGPVSMLLTGSDYLPDIRVRLLVCERLGIPLVAVQHGAFLAAHGGRHGHPNHRHAHHNLLYGRAAAVELAGIGARGRAWTIGWPQVICAEARQALRGARTGARPTDGRWLLLPTGTGAQFDARCRWTGADRFLRDAIAAWRERGDGAPLAVKCHPFADNVGEIREFCVAAGAPDVIIETGLDPWAAVDRAALVIANNSTSALVPLTLGVPTVVHATSSRAWYRRFPDVLVSTTRDELLAALDALPARAPAATPRTYARSDTNPARRAAAAIRAILRGARRPRAAVPRPTPAAATARRVRQPARSGSRYIR
ncbi:MAG: hypothetical protein NW201_08440 [Gemmatimonadales bacterium]|nr:hypothetical protein [Gemmatimonadales bacterium]